MLNFLPYIIRAYGYMIFKQDIYFLAPDAELWALGPFFLGQKRLYNWEKDSRKALAIGF
jgi:hypothetical protein